MSDPRFLILIGAARSGTKFLRDTLAAADGFAAIPFDVNFLWRRGHEEFPHDELGADDCDDALAARIRRELVAKAGRTGRAGGTIVEKTVSNALRVPFVFRAFPEARYVFLVRDGKAVVESSSRVWNEPSSLGYRIRKLRFMGLSELPYLLWYLRSRKGGEKRNPVWGPRYEGIEEDLETLSLPAVCAKQWVACNEAMRRDASLVPPGQIHHVRYEDLVRDESAIRELCDFAGVGNADPVLERFGATVQAGANAKSEDAFSPETVEDLAVIMNPTLEALGYEPFSR